jgi:phenylalanyl-tRNA synthetase beta chain
MVQAGSPGPARPKLSLRLSQLKRILGVELPADEIVAAFSRLGLSPQRKADAIEVTPPSHRLDINEEIDLVEEAARLLGYDRIPQREEISIRLAPPQKDWVTKEAICQLLVAGGYFEAITFSFIDDALRSDFGAAPFRADAAVRKADAALRPSLIPGLLQAVRFNETSGNLDARLFEIGSVFPACADKLDERRCAAWVGGDLRHVRGMAETILARLDAERQLKVVPDSRPGLAKGACGRLVWGGQSIGYLGEVSPEVSQKLSLREKIAAAELDLALLLAGAREVPQLRLPPRLPPVRRDVSLIVADSVPFEKIDALVRVEFVTTYRGKPLEKGTKSVTIALVFRSSEATLTSEQVEGSVQSVVAAAKEQLGAALRT